MKRKTPDPRSVSHDEKVIERLRKPSLFDALRRRQGRRIATDGCASLSRTEKRETDRTRTGQGHYSIFESRHSDF